MKRQGFEVSARRRVGDKLRWGRDLYVRREEKVGMAWRRDAGMAGGLLDRVWWLVFCVERRRCAKVKMRVKFLRQNFRGNARFLIFVS